MLAKIKEKDLKAFTNGKYLNVEELKRDFVYFEDTNKETACRIMASNEMLNNGFDYLLQRHWDDDIVEWYNNLVKSNNDLFLQIDNNTYYLFESGVML